jgi:hypothetical protein
VVESGGGTTDLGQSRRKAITGGVHLLVERGVGRRRREVRRFPVEAAIRQGATDSRPTGLRGQAGPAERPRPSGERESGPVGERKASGPRLGQKPELGPIQELKPF